MAARTSGATQNNAQQAARTRRAHRMAREDAALDALFEAYRAAGRWWKIPHARQIHRRDVRGYDEVLTIIAARGVYKVMLGNKHLITLTRPGDVAAFLQARFQARWIEWAWVQLARMMLDAALEEVRRAVAPECKPDVAFEIYAFKVAHGNNKARLDALIHGKLALPA